MLINCRGHRAGPRDDKSVGNLPCCDRGKELSLVISPMSQARVREPSLSMPTWEQIVGKGQQRDNRPWGWRLMLDTSRCQFWTGRGIRTVSLGAWRILYPWPWFSGERVFANSPALGATGGRSLPCAGHGARLGDHNGPCWSGDLRIQECPASWGCCWAFPLPLGWVRRGCSAVSWGLWQACPQH